MAQTSLHMALSLVLIITQEENYICCNQECIVNAINSCKYLARLTGKVYRQRMDGHHKVNQLNDEFLRLIPRS